MYRSNIQKKPQYFQLLHLFIHRLFSIWFMSKNSAHEGRFEKVASYKFPPNLTQSRQWIQKCPIVVDSYQMQIMWDFNIQYILQLQKRYYKDNLNWYFDCNSEKALWQNLQPFKTSNISWFFDYYHALSGSFFIFKCDYCCPLLLFVSRLTFQH